jgi:hypothetical protein
MKAQTGKQDRRRRGFQDVVIRAHLKGQNMIHIAVERGQQHDRAVPLRAQIPAKRHAIFSGQHNVQQHQVRIFAGDDVFSAIATRFDNHFNIMFTQISGDQLTHFGFIFNINNLIHTTSVIAKNVNIHRTTLTFH